MYELYVIFRMNCISPKHHIVLEFLVSLCLCFVCVAMSVDVVLQCCGVLRYNHLTTTTSIALQIIP